VNVPSALKSKDEILVLPNLYLFIHVLNLSLIKIYIFHNAENKTSLVSSQVNVTVPSRISFICLEHIMLLFQFIKSEDLLTNVYSLSRMKQ
jgi:hypothetical protein